MTAPFTLTPEEARVVGCLMEKAATTPDQYPLSLHALVTACNQTTNRDPVVRYDEQVVERALESLRERGLARRVKSAGQRVVKHRHVADEALGLNQAELAISGVLLLRGAQTPGELKARTERWHRFTALDHVDAALEALAAKGLAVQLARRPGQKEARWAPLLVATAAGGDTDEGAPTGATPTGVAPASLAGSGTPPPVAAAGRGTSGSGAVAPATPPAPAAAPASVRAAAPHSLEVRNPATGELVRAVAVTEDGEIAQKVARARAAQPRWHALAPGERAAALQRFHDLLAAEAEECAQLTTREMGKPIRQSRNEVRAVLERIAWNVEHVERVIAPRAVTDGTDLVERVTYEPLGVVAHVSAWNYPYFVGCNTIVPALLTGNAVVYKPSELATLTGLRLVDLLHRAGVPVDLVHAVVGGGAAGAALVDAEVDMVCFTGSYATGRAVASAVADRLLRVQLELGGKDAAYVCDDVDVDAAAIDVAEGAFYNAGQSCSATERVYVHEAIWERFTDAFADVVRAYRVGDPTDEQTDIGPLARAAQVEVLHGQVAEAERLGAKVVCGGEPLGGPGNWFAPTVLLDVRAGMAIVDEESFGPVIGLQRVAGDAEATTAMDRTRYGLGAAVFTRDQARAEAILASLDVGNAYWNTADRSCVRLPWAGRRHSGLGVSMSESGVRSFVQEKAWHLRPAP